MTREISTPVILEHTDIVPGSEIVTVKNSPIPALIRDSDYIIDYKNGEIRFLSDGAAVELSSLIEESGIDVVYSHQIDFSNPSLFESQIEVFDEVASRVSDFIISTANGPIHEVSRILNLTTQEEYTSISINNNQATFQGVNPPRVKSFEKISTQLVNTYFDLSSRRHQNLFNVSFPSGLSPTLNTIIELEVTQSISTYPYLLVIGGEETLQTTIKMLVPLETTDIQLTTGGRSLRASSITLTSNVDYTFSLVNVPSYSDIKELTINFGAQAIQKIRSNNLYMSLAFLEVPILTTPQFSTTTHHVHNLVSFVTGNNQALVSLPRQTNLGPNGDMLTFPAIQVMDSLGFIYQKGIDYEVNTTQRKISKIPTGRIGQGALVFYIEDRLLKVDTVMTQDIVLIDYIWTNNSLNWESVKKEVPTTQVDNLKKGTQSITLNSRPLNLDQILIYRLTDVTKASASKVKSFNATTNRLMIEPIEQADTYVFEYIASAQPISEGTPYFVSYKYGATRSTLKDKFAKLVGIDSTTTSREEVKSFKAGSSSCQLSRSPTSLETILIFLESDQQESPVATVARFDNITSTLYFTSISSSGKYIIRYVTDGFDTKNLRQATTKLFEAFPEGPTLKGFQDIIAGFVSTPAEISSGLTNRFTLPNKTHTTGNEIALKTFESSPPLSNGAPSVTFLPSRFNLGALMESSRTGFVKAPSVSNIGLLEGTLEFLAGIVFNTTDGLDHYFVDIGDRSSRKNRFSVYKSKTNKLNFDIWDNEGNLFRASADVNQVYHTEIITLSSGAEKATLKFEATPAQLDLNSDRTPDLYGALETKFIIQPETPTFPESYRKSSIKVLGYDASTKVVTFEPIDFSGRYIFSYVGGLVKFEQTENFIAVTWKLHTFDGQPPFYRLYINGRKVINQTLADIGFVPAESNKSSYDTAQYDTDVYEE